MEWQVLNDLEAAHSRITHGLNLLFVLWLGIDNLDRGVIVDNDRIASIIYIVLEQFDIVADEIKNCMDNLQAKQK